MHLSYLQLGPLHIPIFGVFAAIGLMSALTLSQRTARYAGLAPEAVWNAGMASILSAFVISRLLLVAFNFRSFLQYPLLILALPSLTSTGILLTGAVMFGYTRWRNLALVPLLDAVAPCAALLWAFLSLGRYFDGTRDGMPIFLYGSIHHTIAVHPVEIYTFLAAALLSAVLLLVLRSHAAEGRTTVVALISSGLVIFCVDFFRLPSGVFDRAPLEGSQIIGTAMILIGACLLMRLRTRIARESGNEAPHAI